MKYAWVEDAVGNGQVTKLGQGATEPNEKEGEITPQQLTVLPQEYNMSAKMYEVVNSIFQAKSEAAREALILADIRSAKQSVIKAQCQEYIYGIYPAPIQSSLSLGIYSSTDVDIAREFIAACIEEENRVFDLLASEDITSVSEIDAIEPIWPDKPV